MYLPLDRALRHLEYYNMYIIFVHIKTLNARYISVLHFL